MNRGNLVPPLLAVATALVASVTSAHADLLEYVRKPDPSYAWKKLREDKVDGGTIHSLALTSQTWQSIPWTHQLTVYEPKELIHPDAVLLFVTGGSMDRQPKPEDHLLPLGLAKLCGARVALLPQVPNQPLLGGRKEDDLITETFVRYLETKDENWPLLFPMAKSAVKAMDAVQELGREQGKPVARFVVTGASKRGWTTWLTGIVDDRVVAIAPMVIPTLNFRKQIPHQKEYFGAFSEQIEDYVRRGLLKELDDPERSKLWTMVDPFSYLDRLANKPILMINGTNDRYWTLDSVNLFWDDLPRAKYVVYAPNSGHNLKPNIEYATNGIGAFFRMAISGRPMPKLTWEYVPTANGGVRLEVRSEQKPKSIVVLGAHGESNDLREANWEPLGRIEGAQGAFSVDPPSQGTSALFADVTYEIDGFEYHLSTTIHQLGVKLSK